ncbi:hypothetical protein D3C81_1836890 [compost metagenome]
MLRITHLEFFHPRGNELGKFSVYGPIDNDSIGAHANLPLVKKASNYSGMCCGF